MCECTGQVDQAARCPQGLPGPAVAAPVILAILGAILALLSECGVGALGVGRQREQWGGCGGAQIGTLHGCCSGAVCSSGAGSCKQVSGEA